jgi:hypothetical protein
MSKWFSWKIDWLFSVLCLTHFVFTYICYGDSIIAGLVSIFCPWLLKLSLGAFEQEGIFIVPHLLWHGTSVFPKDHPIQLHLRHTLRGCGESIETRILTGPVEWDCLYTNRGIRLPWPNLLFTSQAWDSEPCRFFFPVGTLFIWWHMVLLQRIR